MDTMLPLYRTPVHIFNYDEIPPGYYFEAMQNGSPVQKFWHRHKFLEVANRIELGARVLDLGCGPGSFLSIVGESRPDISGIGVDIASPQIDFAMRNIAPKFDGKISFQQHDAADPQLPFADASFDVVTTIEVIEHIHPFIAYKMLEDAKRVLKPHGRIIVTTPNYRSAWPLIELALQYLSPVKYHEQHINKFTPNSLVKFMESVGLHVTRLDTLFVGSPFLAALSDTLAKQTLSLERASKFRIGSLLIAEAKLLGSTRYSIA